MSVAMLWQAGSIADHLFKKIKIDEDTVLKAETVDADGWRRLLCSSVFGTTYLDLCKAIAKIIKTLFIEPITPWYVVIN